MAPVHRTSGENEHLGYDVKLCDPKAFKRYQCPLCKLLIRNPIQTERGELACEWCYNEAKRDDGKCPIDGERLYGKEFKDRGKQRDILGLACFCCFAGCRWQGELQYLEAHLEMCEYKPANCQLCQQEFPQSSLSRHFESCTELLANGCMYKGCPHQPESVEGLKLHLKDSVIHHAYLQSAAIMDMEEQINSQSSFYENLIKEKEEERKSEMAVIKLQASEMADMLKNLMTNQNRNNGVADLEERIKKLEDNQSEYVSLQTDSSNSTENAELGRLASEVVLINKSISDVDLRLQLFENTSYDGKLVWKVDNIKTRLNQAVAGTVTALHSAPTFTQKNEYKFCARLYLNGDGVGKGTHVSLFFVLMKSEYDSLLTWPFTKRVSFKLLNQKKTNNPVEESFVPDRNSSSFARPKKDMNIASGCPAFVSLEQFKTGGYVEGDCIFIEVQVSSP